MSDDDNGSDSDDSIFAVPAFASKKNKRKRSAKGKQVSRAFDIMEEALAHSERLTDQDDRIVQIKQQQEEEEIIPGDDDSGYDENNLKLNGRKKSEKNNNSDDRRHENLVERADQEISKNEERQKQQEQGVSRSDFILGIKEDEDGGALSRDRRLSLAAAADTAQSSPLGIRRTISFIPMIGEHFLNCLTTTRSEKGKRKTSFLLIKDLKTLLKTITNTKNRTPNNDDTMIIKKVIVNPLQKVIKLEILEEFLQERRLASLQKKHGLKSIPNELTSWLYTVACCSGESSLSRGAYATLEALWSQNNHNNEDDNDHNNVTEPIDEPLSSSIMTLDQMNSHLKNWIDRCNNNCQNEQQEEKDSSPSKKIREKNLPGLAKFMHLWNAALKNGQVKPLVANQQSIAAAERFTDDLKAATCVIVGLAQVGLDTSFHSVEESFDLKDILRDLYCELISFVARDLFIDETFFFIWMEDTSKQIVSTCATLGPGLPNADDSSDCKAWLCLSQVARIFPSHHLKDRDDLRISQFKAVLSMQALQYCVEVKNGISWKEEVCSILRLSCDATKPTNDNTTSEKSPPSTLEIKAAECLRWLSISSSFAALEIIEREGEIIKMDGPRCLATVELSFCCLDAGLQLIKEVSPAHTECLEYRTRDEADAYHCILVLLEERSQQLMTRMNHFSSNAMFRRIAYRLNCMHLYYSRIQDNAKHHAGIRKQNIVQKDIRGLFRSSPLSKTH